MPALSGVMPALALSSLCLACASTGRVARTAACTQPELDSLWLVAGPVYRECEVDVPARPRDPYLYQPNFTPFGSQSCYDAQVRFVVDTSGAVEPGTVRIVSSNSPQMTNSLLRSVPGWRYRPAVKNGVRVRQAVEDGRAAVPFQIRGYGTLYARLAGTRCLRSN
jgi:hypothetical protein